MLNMRTNRGYYGRLSISMVCAIPGVALLTVVLFRQFSENGFINILLLSYIYLLPFLCVLIFLSGELCRCVHSLNTVGGILTSKKTLHILVSVVVFLLAVPLSKLIFDEVLLVISFVTSYIFAMNLYHRMLS